MKLTSKKKKKHISTFFQSELKKFNFYYKPRNFNKLITKNFFLKKKFIYSLISLDSKFLFINSILACIKLIKFFLKLFLLEITNLLILIFPDFILTSKPKEVRMGRGKGNIYKKIVLLKKNTLIFLLNNINKYYAYYILNQCKKRLPCKSKITHKI